MAYPYSLITGVSGVLAAQIGGAAPNVVYTTGAQTIGGFKQFSSSGSYAGNLGVGTTNPLDIFQITKAGSGVLGPRIVLQNSSAATAGNAGEIAFLLDGGATLGGYNANVRATEDAAGAGFANLTFGTYNGSTAPAERMRIRYDGNVGIGLTNPTSKLVVSGTSLFTDVVTGLSSITARSYIATVSGVAIPLIGATATGTYNIDFTNSPALQTITITGATLFSGVNYVGGGGVTMRVNVSGANAVPIRFPAAWANGWVTTVPTGLATGRFAVMTLNTFAAADSGVAVAWSVAP